MIIVGLEYRFAPKGRAVTTDEADVPEGLLVLLVDLLVVTLKI